MVKLVELVKNSGQKMKKIEEMGEMELEKVEVIEEREYKFGERVVKRVIADYEGQRIIIPLSVIYLIRQKYKEKPFTKFKVLKEGEGQNTKYKLEIK